MSSITSVSSATKEFLKELPGQSANSANNKPTGVVNTNNSDSSDSEDKELNPALRDHFEISPEAKQTYDHAQEMAKKSDNFIEMITNEKGEVDFIGYANKALTNRLAQPPEDFSKKVTVSIHYSAQVTQTTTLNKNNEATTSYAVQISGKDGQKIALNLTDDTAISENEDGTLSVFSMQSNTTSIYGLDGKE